MQFGTCAIASGVFRSLAVSDVEALHLIRQCRFLESSLNTNFTTRILSSHQEISFSQLKKEIIEVDFSLLLSEASNHASQRYVQAVAASPFPVGQKFGTLHWRRVLFVLLALLHCSDYSVFIHILTTNALFPIALMLLVMTLSAHTF